MIIDILNFPLVSWVPTFKFMLFCVIKFIDFGIVGRVSEQTFKAVNELSTALAVGDYEQMAQAMCNMGATDEEVDVKKFGNDIEKVLANLSKVQPDVMISVAGGGIEASVQVEESKVAQVILDIVKDNALKLPREFGLLKKESLCFDR